MRLGFGTYKFREVEHVPRDYLHTISMNVWRLSPAVKREIDRVLSQPDTSENVTGTLRVST